MSREGRILEVPPPCPRLDGLLHAAQRNDLGDGDRPSEAEAGRFLPVLPAALQLYRGAHTHPGSVVLALPQARGDLPLGGRVAGPPISSPGLRLFARGRWRKALQFRTVPRDQPVTGGILRGVGDRG